MPPRNPARSLFSEDGLAERIAYERERRGMTYEGLAKRMTDVGCPINQSAIYKIEKAKPRRRITVDELVAFSTVFEIDVNDLLLPLEAVLDSRLRELGAEVIVGIAALADYTGGLNDAWQKLRDHLRERPDSVPAFEAWVERSVEDPKLRATVLRLLRKHGDMRFVADLKVRPVEEASRG